MTRKNLPPSAFALPGLSFDKPIGLRNKKQRDRFTTDVSQKYGPYSASGQLADSPSLVDELGEFLAPETGYTLENLTKSRPRSPGRRSPSPLARRKFNDSANVNDQLDSDDSSLGSENVEKSTKDESDRLKALEGRSSFSPALILMNDVGLSVSSSSLEKPPKTPKRNQENHSGSRLRSLENGELEAERQALNATTEAKRFDERGDFVGRINNEPPPVPSVPPPLDDDFVSHKKHRTTFVEAERSLLVNKADQTQPNRTVDKRSERTSYSSSGATGDGHLTTSKKSRFLPRAGIGVEKTLSGDTVSSNLPRIGAVSLEKQISLDSGLSFRPAQPQTSWSSRYRNPVEKNPSARRRRFKPVTLSDEVDSKDANTTEPKQDLPSNSNLWLSGTKYMCGTSAFDSPDKTKIHIPAVNSPGSLDMGYSMETHDTLVNENLQTLNHLAPAEEVANKSVLFSEANNVINNNEPFSTSPEKGNQSKRANLDTMVVFQYDDSPVVSITNKDDTVKKLPSKSLGTASSDSEPRETNGVIDFASSSGKSSESSHHLKAPSVTLPKVVIEYDGMVIDDPVIDEYDTTETSSDDSMSLLTSSSVAANGFHGGDDTGTLIEDVEDLNTDEEDQTLEAEPVKEETTEGQGVQHFEDGEDGFIYHTYQTITKVGHFDDDDNEMLFEPPPMFASSDEDVGVDLDDEREAAEEEREREAYYDMRSSSPAIPPLLLTEQIRDNKPFHNLALEAWTEEDCIDWLGFIGLEHFAKEFQEHHVDGKMLKNVNFQFLEEIGINSPDEREVILSEIYRRFHPEEEDMFEMEVKGALESASEQEKVKIMAVLHALRSPAFQAELAMTSSTGSSSPHDSDTGYQIASETVSLSSSMTGSDDHPRDDAMPPPPPPPTWTQSLQRSEVKHSERERTESRDSTVKEEERLLKTSKGKEKQTEKGRKREKHGHKHKKHKGVAKLLDSLSLSSGSSKLTKLFHSSSSSTSKKLKPAMQYLLQAGPQGLVRVWPMALSEEMNYCGFLVSMTTTCSEVVKLVFDKYEVVDDPRRFYICEVNLGKGGVSHNLSDDDCPLLYQCRWQDPEKYRFELRCRDEGVIKMLFELDEYEGDLDYRSIPLSMKTPCSEALKLIVKKFGLPGDISNYFLMEVSEENEDDREEVADHVYPLRLQRAWSAPDHVFRLCRRPSVFQEGSKENIWIDDATNDTSEELNIYMQSEASSVRDEDEVESTPDIDGVEEDAVVEDTAQELMEGLRELESDDSNSRVETERLASEELRKARQKLLAREYELKELRLKSNVLSEKQREIEDLQRLNEALKTRCEELVELPVIKKKLAEREKDFERLRAENGELHGRMSELEEKSKKEIAMRDREIERLYSRNNELCSKEKEIEKLKKKSEAYDSQEEELEKLRLLQHESSSNQNELVRKLEELQNRHSVMSLEVSQVEELKRINRELCQKVDEGEIVRQRLSRSELERNELGRKLEELERKNRELEAVCDEVERLRNENHILTTKSKDADEMKQNIIKLSAQLREMESHDDFELLRKKIELSEAEKKQLLEKLAELEKQENKMSGNLKHMEDLKLENIFLVERSKEVDELKNTVAKLTAEVRENESFRQKYKELRDVESYLTKQTSSLENIIRQKDRKLKELENKVKSLAESGKDMEAKLEEHEQNRLYLDQLLSMLKDRDPALLHLMNRSLVLSEPEEWC